MFKKKEESTYKNYNNLKEVQFLQTHLIDLIDYKLFIKILININLFYLL